MRIAAITSLPCLLACAAAQTASLHTATVIEVGGAGMTSRVTSTMASATQIAPPAATLAADNHAGAAASASFDLSVPLAARIEFVAGAANSYTVGSGAWGTGSVEWRLQGPGRGWLVVEVDASAGSLTSVVARARVTAPGLDLGTAATQGASHAEHREYLEFAGGFTLTIESAVSASPTVPFRTVRGSVRTILRFEPALPPMRQAAYGQACGAELRVVDDTTATAHALTIEAATGLPLAPAFVVFGDRAAQLPLLGCVLRTVPVVVVPGHTDVLGFATWRFDVVGPRRGAPLFCQALGFDAAWQVRTTAGVELTFID